MRTQKAFSLVEIAVVIIILGLLFVVSYVGYSEVQKNAIKTGLRSDLTKAYGQLDVFQVQKGNYPITIDCSVADSNTNLCLKSGKGVSFSYQYNNAITPKGYCLTATDGNNYYYTQGSTSSTGAPNFTQGVCSTCAAVPTNLSLCIDIGTNLSYDGTSSSIYSLNNSNIFTLNSSSYYSYDSGSKSLLFSRTMPPAAKNGGYAASVMSGDLTAQNYLHNDHTTEIWFKSNNRSPTLYDTNEGASAIAVYAGYHSMWYYNGTSYTYTIWGKTSGVDNNYTLAISDSTVSTWTQLVAVRSGNTLSLYKNGQLKNSGTITAGTEGISTGNNLRIAMASLDSQSFTWHADIYFSSLKMYKRALTASEVVQSFDASRSRYGI